MSLESFYGGKPGISPVIKKAFKYVDKNDNAYQAALSAGATAADLLPFTMDECFANAEYEEVWYSELCIIDTTNKNNPNNGKLFRRTLKGRGNSGLNLCAEYIGQIVGPAGGIPFISLGSVSKVNEQAHKDYVVNDNTEIAYPVDENNISNTKPATDVNPYVFSATNENNMLVPGKTNDGTYNDSIKYTWFNIRNNTNESLLDSWVYLGMTIPYPSIDIETITTDWTQEASILKHNTDEHPFYHSWQISVPRGIRGNAPDCIRLAQYKDFSNLSGESDKPFLYDFAKSVVEDSSNKGRYIINQVTPDEFKDLTTEDKTRLINSYLFVYDYIFYDKEEGEDASFRKYTFFIGLYNTIKNVVLNEDGTISFNYTNTTTNTFEKVIKWIDTISVSETGVIKVEYNTGDFVSWQFPYPESITLSDAGVINFTFKNGKVIPVTMQSTGQNLGLNFVDSIEMDADTKQLFYSLSPIGTETVLNNGEGINYIKAMTIDEKYHLLAYYASTQKRITVQDISAGMKNGFPVVVENTPQNYNIARWNNQIFRNGIVYGGIPQSDYWQDFGLIRQTQQGIRIMAEINYSDYKYAATVPTLTKNEFIADVLMPEYWDEDNEILNPYYEGAIPGTDYNGNPLRGTFVYTPDVEDGSAYYYDYDANAWKFAGAWGSTTVETDIKIINPETNLPTNDVQLSTSGVTFSGKQVSLSNLDWPTLW